MSKNIESIDLDVGLLYYNPENKKEAEIQVLTIQAVSIVIRDICNLLEKRIDTISTDFKLNKKKLLDGLKPPV